MNRHQRRGEAAKACPSGITRAEVIRLTMDYLANRAAPTATGATIVLPDGAVVYVSADDARRLHGDSVAGGCA